MSTLDYGQNLNLKVPLHVEPKILVDEDGILKFRVLFFADADSDKRELDFPFYELTEELLDDPDEDQDYALLYDIANELVRESERIREVANRIESSVSNVADLFNTSPNVPST
tara:strand:- start:6711 stop:7049 length:339 start_codon:yes stop_codon:yes gene_type:complete